jgi:hypothetical protein
LNWVIKPKNDGYDRVDFYQKGLIYDCKSKSSYSQADNMNKKEMLEGPTHKMQLRLGDKLAAKGRSTKK